MRSSTSPAGRRYSGCGFRTSVSRWNRRSRTYRERVSRDPLRPQSLPGDEFRDRVHRRDRRRSAPVYRTARAARADVARWPRFGDGPLCASPHARRRAAILAAWRHRNLRRRRPDRHPDPLRAGGDRAASARGGKLAAALFRGLARRIGLGISVLRPHARGPADQELQLAASPPRRHPGATFHLTPPRANPMTALAVPQTDERKRILVVDDSLIMRQLVREIVDSDPDLEVVDTAENGRLA